MGGNESCLIVKVNSVFEIFSLWHIIRIISSCLLFLSDLPIWTILIDTHGTIFVGNGMTASCENNGGGCCHECEKDHPAATFSSHVQSSSYGTNKRAVWQKMSHQKHNNDIKWMTFKAGVFLNIYRYWKIYILATKSLLYYWKFNPW